MVVRSAQTFVNALDMGGQNHLTPRRFQQLALQLFDEILKGPSLVAELEGWSRELEVVEVGKVLGSVTLRKRTLRGSQCLTDRRPLNTSPKTAPCS